MMRGTPLQDDTLADHQPGQPSLGDLFADLSRHLSTLVRQEMALARTEVARNASWAGRGATQLSVGGAIAYAGLLAIVAAVIIALAHVITWWLSALLVGIVVAGVGYILVRQGLDALKHVELAPQQTLDTLKEDMAWAKEQMN
jgi:hypothetical protein